MGVVRAHPLMGAVRSLLLASVPLACHCFGGVSDDLCESLGIGCDHKEGCMAVGALNFDSDATFDDGSSCVTVGCMASVSPSYDPSASIDNGCHGGCTSPSALNFDSLASWTTQCVYTCNDPTALNYQAYAVCISRIYGCMIELALNYESEANTADNANCTFASPPPPPPPPTLGCTDPTARTYDSLATVLEPEACIYTIRGCTDSVSILPELSPMLESLCRALLPMSVPWGEVVKSRCRGMAHKVREAR